MKPLSGNVSDPGSFPKLIDRHIDHLQHVHGFDYVVADSALYSADHVEELSDAGVKFAGAGSQNAQRGETADPGSGD